MTSPGAPPALRPGRVWYSFAAALFLLSLVPALLLGRQAVGAIAVDVEPLPAGPVNVGDDQLAVYVDRTDVLGRVSCTAEGAGETSTSLEAPDASFSPTVAGREWHRIAVTPPSLAPGAYTLSCGGSDVTLRADDLGVGGNPQLLRLVVLLVLAFAIPVIAAAGGAVIVIVTALRRRRARQAQSAAGSYLPPAY